MNIRETTETKNIMYRHLGDDESVSDGNAEGWNLFFMILFFCLTVIFFTLIAFVLRRRYGWCNSSPSTATTDHQHPDVASYGCCPTTPWYMMCFYCCGQRCCWSLDLEAYRHERESLERLRELRRLHRLEQFQLRTRQAHVQAAALRSMRAERQYQYNSSSRYSSGALAPSTRAYEFGSIPNAQQLESNNSNMENNNDTTNSSGDGNSQPQPSLGGIPLPPLATFSQIPGAIPNTLSSSGRVLTPEELHLQEEYRRGHATHFLARTYEQMNNLGFILIPSSFQFRQGGRRNRGEGFAPSTTHNTAAIRASLTPHQRRAILERLVVCKKYSNNDSGGSDNDGDNHGIADEKDSITATDVSHRKKDDNKKNAAVLTVEDMVDIEVGVSSDHDCDSDKQGNRIRSTDENSRQASGSATETVVPAVASQTTTLQQQQEQIIAPARPTPFALPLHHEEPQNFERTCAICLDNFEAGELINDTPTKCRHVFHKECLLEWLDRHDVCPCCRHPMISEDEWQTAAAATRTPPPMTTNAVSSSNNAAEENENQDNNDQDHNTN